MACLSFGSGWVCADKLFNLTLPMKDFEKDRIFFVSGNLIKVHIGIVNFIITVEMVEHLTDTCAQNGITKPYNL